jgi:hypothetical protein
MWNPWVQEFVPYRSTLANLVIERGYALDIRQPISILHSNAQAVIDQLVNAIYDAQDAAKSHFDLRDYFTEFSLSQQDQRKAFSLAGYGIQLRGSLRLRDGDAPLRDAVISMQLSQHFSRIPTFPDGLVAQDDLLSKKSPIQLCLTRTTTSSTSPGSRSMTGSRWGQPQGRPSWRGT